MGLPTDYNARKNFPLMTFLTSYFPDTIEALVDLCVQGNIQHEITVPKDNPFYMDGDRIAWDRSKSTEEVETGGRHLWDHIRAKRRWFNLMNIFVQPKRYSESAISLEDPIKGLYDTDGVLHIVKASWRCSAEAQKTIEHLRSIGYPSRMQVEQKPLPHVSSCDECGGHQGAHNWPGCNGKFL